MKTLLSVQETAKLLGISKVAVLKQIKAGKIKALKIGHAYIIARDDLTIVSTKEVSPSQKAEIEEAVSKTINEYSETLRLLKDT